MMIKHKEQGIQSEINNYDNINNYQQVKTVLLHRKERNLQKSQQMIDSGIETCQLSHYFFESLI